MIKDAPTVLLVEDDRDGEELTIRGLQGTHLKNPIDVAHDGQQAVDYLLRTDERAAKPLPAVVLLDLKLPRLSGLEVLKRIRAASRTRRVPVVILTSSSEDADLISGYDSGANSFVRKPIQFEDFATAIKQLGVYWLMVNERPPPADHETGENRG